MILDVTYGSYQSQQSKNEFIHYTQQTTATITSYQKIRSAAACKNAHPCTLIVMEFTYDDNQGNKNSTQVSNMQSKNTKLGDKITVLCHPVQWICVPKQYVETHSSLSNNLWSVTLIKIIKNGFSFYQS